jgi:thymidylate synthase
MNNRIDQQYKKLIEQILNFGVEKKDRTGTGTKSIFGWQIRHKMSEGFPLLTTKKMHWKSIVTELLWFLRGDTNIKFLLDYDCHIWDGDAYKNYVSKIEEYASTLNVPNDISEFQEIMDSVGNQIKSSILSKEEFIKQIKTDNEFAKKRGDLGPIYGKQWRDWNGIDQIQNLINELKSNPDSRRLMVNAWNVGELNQMVLPPCHYGFQVYTRELTAKERTAYASKGSTAIYDAIKESNYETIDADIEMHKVCDEKNIPRRAISLMWNQRSVDTFLGLPFNIASYALLLEIIAKQVNMIPDELIGNLGDVHLYNNHIEQAKEQCNRTPYDLPKLNINTEFWPTENSSCGEGLLDTSAIFEAFKNDNFCRCLLEEDLQLYDYQSHPAIKAPLSN